MAIVMSVLKHDKDSAVGGIGNSILRPSKGEGLPIHIDQFPNFESCLYASFLRRHSHFWLQCEGEMASAEECLLC